MKGENWCLELIKVYKKRRRFHQNQPVPHAVKVERLNDLIQLLEVIVG